MRDKSHYTKGEQMVSSSIQLNLALWVGLFTTASAATTAGLFLLWLLAGGGAWHGGVSIVEALPRSETVVVLRVGACQRAPSVSFINETDSRVEVKVEAYSTLLGTELHCLDEITLHLREPLGDRTLIDRHTGRPVNVITPETSEGSQTQTSAFLPRTATKRWAGDGP